MHVGHMSLKKLSFVKGYHTILYNYQQEEITILQFSSYDHFRTTRSTPHTELDHKPSILEALKKQQMAKEQELQRQQILLQLQKKQHNLQQQQNIQQQQQQQQHHQPFLLLQQQQLQLLRKQQQQKQQKRKQQYLSKHQKHKQQLIQKRAQAQWSHGEEVIKEKPVKEVRSPATRIGSQGFAVSDELCG